jgi:two-component system, OmpR family, sensor kinase
LINKSSDIKYIFVQGILTLCIAFIPIYFYIDTTLENQNIKDQMKLKNYTTSIISKMEAVKYENSDIFYYPRSNIFISGIFDENDTVIFSLLKKEIPIQFNSKYYESSKYICYKQYLQNNIFGAKYIISCKTINNSQMIFNVLILLLTIACLMFLSSFITIKQSIEPYKKLNIYLDNFLKDAMHELKTPIGVARVNIDMLQMKLKNNKHLIRIKSALKNMTVVYEDLEYYMQRHSVRNDKKTIHFSEFLQKRIEFFSDLATAKNIEFKTNIEKDIFIEFNDIALSRIIDNNLSNAIKYSKDTASIEISLAKKTDSILLTFEDNGSGIQDTSKIFERYYREDKISGGFGIGLSIVKRICDTNNIHIEIYSKVGVGTKFLYKFDGTPQI